MIRPDEFSFVVIIQSFVSVNIPLFNIDIFDDFGKDIELFPCLIVLPVIINDDIYLLYELKNCSYIFYTI